MPAKARKRSQHLRMSVLGFLVLGGLTAAGCASQPAPAKVGSGAEPPASGEEAERTLADAENELTSMLLDGGTQAEPFHEEPNDVSPAPPPPPGDAHPMADSETNRRQQRCTRACKALASMERAANGLCELTGDGDARCDSARERLRAAQELVRRTCSSCG
jgi:hypothetical protein